MAAQRLRTPRQNSYSLSGLTLPEEISSSRRLASASASSGEQPGAVLRSNSPASFIRERGGIFRANSWISLVLSMRKTSRNPDGSQGGKPALHTPPTTDPFPKPQRADSHPQLPHVQPPITCLHPYVIQGRASRFMRNSQSSSIAPMKTPRRNHMGRTTIPGDISSLHPLDAFG